MAQVHDDLEAIYKRRLARLSERLRDPQLRAEKLSVFGVSNKPGLTSPVPLRGSPSSSVSRLRQPGSLLQSPGRPRAKSTALGTRQPGVNPAGASPTRMRAHSAASSGGPSSAQAAQGLRSKAPGLATGGVGCQRSPSRSSAGAGSLRRTQSALGSPGPERPGRQGGRICRATRGGARRESTACPDDLALRSSRSSASGVDASERGGAHEFDTEPRCTAGAAQEKPKSVSSDTCSRLPTQSSDECHASSAQEGPQDQPQISARSAPGQKCAEALRPPTPSAGEESPSRSRSGWALVGGRWKRSDSDDLGCSSIAASEVGNIEARSSTKLDVESGADAGAGTGIFDCRACPGPGAASCSLSASGGQRRAAAMALRQAVGLGFSAPTTPRESGSVGQQQRLALRQVIGVGMSAPATPRDNVMPGGTNPAVSASALAAPLLDQRSLLSELRQGLRRSIGTGARTQASPSLQEAGTEVEPNEDLCSPGAATIADREAASAERRQLLDEWESVLGAVRSAAAAEECAS